MGGCFWELELFISSFFERRLGFAFLHCVFPQMFIERRIRFAFLHCTMQLSMQLDTSKVLKSFCSILIQIFSSSNNIWCAYLRLVLNSPQLVCGSRLCSPRTQLLYKHATAQLAISKMGAVVRNWFKSLNWHGDSCMVHCVFPQMLIEGRIRIAPGATFWQEERRVLKQNYRLPQEYLGIEATNWFLKDLEQLWHRNQICEGLKKHINYSWSSSWSGMQEAHL